jgi:hypothetical protein
VNKKEAIAAVPVPNPWWPTVHFSLAPAAAKKNEPADLSPYARMQPGGANIWSYKPSWEGHYTPLSNPVEVPLCAADPAPEDKVFVTIDLGYDEPPETRVLRLATFERWRRCFVRNRPGRRGDNTTAASWRLVSEAQLRVLQEFNFVTEVDDWGWLANETYENDQTTDDEEVLLECVHEKVTTFTAGIDSRPQDWRRATEYVDAACHMFIVEPVVYAEYAEQRAAGTRPTCAERRAERNETCRRWAAEAAEAADHPDVPDAPEAAEAAEAADSPEAAEAADAPDVPDVADVADAAEPPDAANDPDAAAEPPEDPDAAEPPDAANGP